MARKRKSEGSGELFIEGSGQLRLVEKSVEQDVLEQRKVECLGTEFDSDDARRAHFADKLREKLADPAFRKTPGFPKGTDEDIIRMSDPPWYTACPNPFITDFVKHYGKPFEPAERYSCNPFATDVSEGKNDPIYNAHSYHTKVPHKAIMRYILHYTQPGDIVFDGFCGTGMTGVAAQMCADKAAVESLNLKVQKDSSILDGSERIGTLGLRHAILCDLSPVASFVAARYNDLRPSVYSSHQIKKLIASLKEKFGDYYSTRVPNSKSAGVAQFYVWSEIFACPHCAHAAPLFALAVDSNTHQLRDTFSCPSCNAELSKDVLERVWATLVDPVDGQIRKEAKCELVEVAARSADRSIRYLPTKFDQDKIDSINPQFLDHAPTDEFPHGRQTRKVKTGSGISTIRQMFTPRALAIISGAWEMAHSDEFRGCRDEVLFLLSSILTLVSRRERYRDGTGKGAQSGTLYVPSLQIEKNVFDVLERKRKSFCVLDLTTSASNAIVTCQSHGDLVNVPSDSVDYIFTDPPFGESLQYAELNFFHEAWFRVQTQLSQDCVLNYVHEKDLSFYRALMSEAFTEAHRILKPGRWITVEFHNSQNSVWMAIQEALWRAGLTIADVRILDKKQGTFNVVNRAGAVKQDLVISAYKPTSVLEERFKLSAGSESGVWDFIRSHLSQLPVFVIKEGKAEIVTERQNYLLFDRMVAFHVQRGVTVPLSAVAFYGGLAQRFSERDGMYFLSEQVAEYDRKRTNVKEILQLELFVTDESSAIEWLKQQLARRPQTFQELQPQFMRETQGGWQKHEKPLELSGLLAQNFLCYDGAGDVPSQIHSYLSSNFRELRNLAKDALELRTKGKDRWYLPDPNKAGDLEQLRDKSLLSEFETYKQSKERKLKLFRAEAVRAGFKFAYEAQDYKTIVSVATKLPEEVLQEDEKLLMYYDVASMRLGDE